jgi:RNA polymerase sigma-70 factor (ECF subfamily)
LTDKEILGLFHDGSSRHYGFNLLVRKYQKRIYLHIRRMVIVHDDADDLVQEAFIKVWKNLSGFRNDSQLYTWIYRIATNEALAFLKKKNRKLMFITMNAEGYEKQLSKNIEDDNWFTGDEIQMKLQKAMLTLPAKQRLVFNMKYFDEMKYHEISEVTGTSVGALKASYHIAVKKIEEYLKND